MHQPAVCRAELRHAIEQAATDSRPGDGGSSCKAAGTAEARVLLPSCSQDPCLASRLVPLLQLAKHTDSRSGGLGCGTCKARLVKSVGMLNHPHSAIMTIHCVLIPDHLTVSLLHFSVLSLCTLAPVRLCLQCPLPMCCHSLTQSSAAVHGQTWRLAVFSHGHQLTVPWLCSVPCNNFCSHHSPACKVLFLSAPICIK